MIMSVLISKGLTQIYNSERTSYMCAVHRYIGPGRLFERNEEAAGDLGFSCVLVSPKHVEARLTKSHCYLPTKFSLFFSTFLNDIRAPFPTDIVT